jgi:predicted nucleic acid-binding protein
MRFVDLAPGDAVFIDANTLIYYFAPHPTLGPPCSQLLERIDNQELTGYTSIHLLAEVAHRLMTLEANTTLGWPMTGMANRLRRNPDEVRKLGVYKTALEEIARSKIQVLGPGLLTLRNAADVCRRTGLLINDALVVAIMEEHGLTRLASHDGDFDRVPGLTRFAPA